MQVVVEGQDHSKSFTDLWKLYVHTGHLSCKEQGTAYIPNPNQYTWHFLCEV